MNNIWDNGITKKQGFQLVTQRRGLSIILPTPKPCTSFEKNQLKITPPPNKDHIIHDP